MIIGARSNFSHSSSNLPGFGVAALVIRLLVDSSVYANCVYCVTAAFLPMKHWSIALENFAILLAVVSEALNLGVCTTESAPSNILLIKGNSGNSSGSFLSSPQSFVSSFTLWYEAIKQEFLLPRHSFYRTASKSRVLGTPQYSHSLLHPFSHGNDHQSLLLSYLALISSRTANPYSSFHVTHSVHTN